MTRIAVVDHGAGNLVSIGTGLERSGAEVAVVTTPDELGGADGVVLPGVGSSAAAMERLRAARLDGALASWTGPLLGICVGFQLLFDRSEEGGGPCLGMIPGTVRRLRARPLPHMGWNDVSVVSPDPLLGGLDGELFYFVHSYVPVPDDPAAVLAVTDHQGAVLPVAARAGAAVGVQFHPERSGAAGRALLSNFVRMCAEAARAA